MTMRPVYLLAAVSFQQVLGDTNFGQLQVLIFLNERYQLASTSLKPLVFQLHFVTGMLPTVYELEVIPQ